MRIAVIHPWLGSGGSEARAMWITEALKDLHQVTIVTTAGGELDRLNRLYGTDIQVDEISMIETGYSWWLSKIGFGDALKGAFFQRELKKLGRNYDLAISAYNLICVSVPTIQFIADFSWDDAERRRLHPEHGWRGFLHGDSVFRRLYLAGVDWLSGGRSAGNILQNSVCIVSNSQFSADILKAKYGVESRVIYPPVVGDFPQVSWEKKKNRFVVLGRISPEKELEKVIQIIEGVREKGHLVGLHILGDWEHSVYGRSLRNQAVTKGSWLRFAGDVRGAKKAGILADSRYAIHGCTGEAFGIAAAEMLKAGCVTFVPDEGGPVEIVDDERLIYSDVNTAVSKIDTVLQNEEQQRGLARHARKQGELFSEYRFMDAVKCIVDEYISG